MRLILMFAACAVACAIAVAVAQTRVAPSRSAYWQTICYLGKYGQPGGCVQVWVGPGPVPQ